MAGRGRKERQGEEIVELKDAILKPSVRKTIAQVISDALIVSINHESELMAKDILISKLKIKIRKLQKNIRMSNKEKK